MRFPHKINFQCYFSSSAAWGNFVICDYDDCTTFGQPYDYLSVMHYSKRAFSKDGLSVTIETIVSFQKYSLVRPQNSFSFTIVFFSF